MNSILPPISRRRFGRTGILVAGCVAALSLTLLVTLDPRASTGTIRILPYQSTALPQTDAAPRVWNRTIASFKTGYAHSPTIIEHADGDMQAMWFYGSGEANPDVGLWSARTEGDAWGVTRMVIDATDDEKALHYRIATIGNPALFHTPTGEIWLAYVDPSIGGWSTSRIALRRSTDQGLTWTAAQQLVTSPFFSMSNLVRFGAMPADNGYMALPAYHEFALKFSELMLLDKDGRVAGKRRIGSSGHLGIQPVIVEESAGHLLAFLRPVKDMAKRIHVSHSTDGGIVWSDPVATSVPNPGAPVCAVRLSSGPIILAYNDTETERTHLRLVAIDPSTSGWTTLGEPIEAQGLPEGSVSYCTMIERHNGDLVMAYSDTSEKSIREFGFNRAWLAGALAGGQRIAP